MIRRCLALTLSTILAVVRRENRLIFSSIQSRLHGLLPLIAILAVGLAPGAVVAAAQSPGTIDIAGESVPRLGDGIRRRFFIKIYRCTLYAMPDRSPMEQVRNLRPVALRIDVLARDLPPFMPASWRRTLKSELEAGLFKAMKRGFRQLERGDVLEFVYFPGRGTEFRLNGEPQFLDPEAGLMEALLDQWIGDRPVSKRLKRALLSAD